MREQKAGFEYETRPICETLTTCKSSLNFQLRKAHTNPEHVCQTVHLAIQVIILVSHNNIRATRFYSY